MAAAEAPYDGSVGRMRLMCSHGGRFLPRGPDGALRYVGGETRVLVVPRAVTFPDLTARLSEMAGGAEVRAIRHRLADVGVQDVIVSVTSDEELAHMRDEYDRLRATRPAATFRVFVTTTAHAGSGGGVVCRRRSAAGLPPLPLDMRRARSEQALAVCAHQQQAKQAMRRVQSTQELARAIHLQPSFHHRCNHQCCSSSQPRNVCALSPMAAQPVCALPYMSKKVAPPWLIPAKATERVFAIRV
ncbi:hypothetical protein SORBI_3001G131200 [Sorghum bicolor]|nr:hypothetical protein SORBI_3001G131200 [Sorghum bicolor]